MYDIDGYGFYVFTVEQKSTNTTRNSKLSYTVLSVNNKRTFCIKLLCIYSYYANRAVLIYSIQSLFERTITRTIN